MDEIESSSRHPDSKEQLLRNSRMAFKAIFLTLAFVLLLPALITEQRASATSLSGEVSCPLPSTLIAPYFNI